MGQVDTRGLSPADRARGVRQDVDLAQSWLSSRSGGLPALLHVDARSQPGSNLLPPERGRAGRGLAWQCGCDPDRPRRPAGAVPVLDADEGDAWPSPRHRCPRRVSMGHQPLRQLAPGVLACMSSRAFGMSASTWPRDTGFRTSRHVKSCCEGSTVTTWLRSFGPQEVTRRRSPAIRPSSTGSFAVAALEDADQGSRIRSTSHFWRRTSRRVGSVPQRSKRSRFVWPSTSIDGLTT